MIRVVAEKSWSLQAQTVGKMLTVHLVFKQCHRQWRLQLTESMALSLLKRHMMINAVFDWTGPMSEQSVMSQLHEMSRCQHCCTHCQTLTIVPDKNQVGAWANYTLQNAIRVMRHCPGYFCAYKDSLASDAILWWEIEMREIGFIGFRNAQSGNSIIGRRWHTWLWSRWYH